MRVRVGGCLGDNNKSVADNFGVGSKNGIHTNASELSFLGGKAWIVLGGGHGTGTTVGCSVRAVGLLLSAPGTEDLTNANMDPS